MESPVLEELHPPTELTTPKVGDNTIQTRTLGSTGIYEDTSGQPDVEVLHDFHQLLPPHVSGAIVQQCGEHRETSGVAGGSTISRSDAFDLTLSECPMPHLNHQPGAGSFNFHDSFRHTGPYNSPETVKKLGEILYPDAPGRSLPEGIDLFIYLTFQKPHALFPISQDLLINGMTFLVEFLGRKEGTQSLQQFTREARSHLSYCGWPSDMQSNEELAWKLFFAAIAFKPTDKFPIASFTRLKAFCFGPTVTSPTFFSFTLAELLALDISITPTHSLHEHLCLDGDKVKVFIVDESNGIVLLSYRFNEVAKILGIDKLGAEIMASIGALVGHDETSRFEEATKLGILPGYGQFQAVFMALIPRTQQPKLLASRVRAIERLIKSRRRWWNVLWRDICKQSKGQPVIFYGAVFAVFFGICTFIQTVTSIMALLQHGSCICTYSGARA